MKLLCAALSIFLVLSSWLSAEDKPPVLLTKVDPNEGQSKAGVIFDAAEVALTLDESGVPFSFESSAGLPEYVVKALEQWRYSPYKRNGRSVPFAVKLSVPVARRLTAQVERNLAPQWRPANVDIMQAIKRGRELDQSSAEALEASLPDAEALGNPRTSLLVYYATKGAQHPEKALAARAKILSWLLAHYPEDDVLGSSFALVNSGGDPLTDADTSSRLAKLWFDAGRQHSGNEKLAVHALNFLQVTNPQHAIGVLSTLPRWKDTVTWAGYIYGLAALGTTAIAPATGRAVAAGGTSVNATFSEFAKQELLKSDNPALVLTGLASFTQAGRSLASLEHLPAVFGEFCPKLLARAKELYPQTSLSCEVLRQASDATEDKNAAYSAQYVEPKLLKRVEPDYPAKARSKGVSGKVTFSAVISRSGELDEIGMKSGPFLLAQAAFGAVGKWRFNPATFHGEPTDMATTIVVSFSLGARY